MKCQRSLLHTYLLQVCNTSESIHFTSSLQLVSTLFFRVELNKWYKTWNWCLSSDPSSLVGGFISLHTHTLLHEFIENSMSVVPTPELPQHLTVALPAWGQKVTAEHKRITAGTIQKNEFYILLPCVMWCDIVAIVLFKTCYDLLLLFNVKYLHGKVFFRKKLEHFKPSRVIYVSRLPVRNYHK